MNKILTIVIPAYNVEAYLFDTLDSINRSEDMRVEAIIVNDGSSDKTCEIAQSFVDQNPAVFKLINKENGGYGSSVNTGLQYAQGKYFRLLDGDDWIEPKTLIFFLNQLENMNDDLVLSPYCEWHSWDQSAHLKELPDWIANDFSNWLASENSSIMRMAWITYRTQLLKDCGLQISENCFYTDTEFTTLPLASVQTKAIINQPLYFYRIGREGQSMSAQGQRAHYKDHEKVLKRLIHETSFEKSDNPLIVFMQKRIAHEAALHYRFLFFINDKKELQKELSSFNSFLLNYPEMYHAAKKISPLARIGQINFFFLNIFAQNRVQKTVMF